MDARGLIGRNFARIRRDRGFTQEAAAARVGVRQSVISDLEAGRSNPTVVSVARLAEGLGADPSELLEMDAVARRERSEDRMAREEES